MSAAAEYPLEEATAFLVHGLSATRLGTDHGGDRRLYGDRLDRTLFLRRDCFSDFFGLRGRLPDVGAAVVWPGVADYYDGGTFDGFHGYLRGIAFGRSCCLRHDSS